MSRIAGIVLSMMTSRNQSYRHLKSGGKDHELPPKDYRNSFFFIVFFSTKFFFQISSKKPRNRSHSYFLQRNIQQQLTVNQINKNYLLYVNNLNKSSIKRVVYVTL